jgi:quinoprotein glucose dehydrogenase|tara:strand:- start:508 stop:2496 length:1989 start_codon:yes stop_codon:yes gene_type:complete
VAHDERLQWRVLRGLAAVAFLTLATGPADAQSPAPAGEWRTFGADAANTKYSPLDQITADNFSDLEIAWRWTSVSTDVTSRNESIRPGQFKTTPLMIGGLVYASTALGQVAAVDAGTGETVWTYDPQAYETLERPANLGWQHRGVAYWSDGDTNDARIFIATHDLRLVALNASTGALYPDFGDGGTVDLSRSLDREIDPTRITHSSPVAIARDTVVVGSVVADRTSTKEAPPGHVRGFDARTGDMKWIFHTIPQGDEFGNDTWQDESWRYTGHTNVWSFMAVDNELGYVYLPIGTATNDWYGGQRRGNNLFAESIVCLDAETGARVWHFQAVHHGLWDYDFPTAPNLLDITVDGRDIKALAQVSKQAFTYVFDRATGEPVWPIEERPVPASTVAGEVASSTQPFPTRPAPFDRQGITVDDLIDFTPELRAEALELVERAQLASIFTPPTAGGDRPTIQLPGDGGGANWPGAAVDPETGRLFVPSSTTPKVVELLEPAAPANVHWAPDYWSTGVPGPRGLPLVKPPYKRITAIDLNTGDHRWMTPHGDGPRDHPALRDLDLPPLGGGGSHAGGPLVTKTLLVVNYGGRDMESTGEVSRTISAYDKDTGAHLGSVLLPAAPFGNPITYLHQGKQYIVVATGGGGFRGAGGVPPQLIALSLPGER